MKKHTLVIGASENPDRYSNKAVKLLVNYNHLVLAVGQKSVEIENIKIEKEISPNWKGLIDTVTLYINPARQKDLYKDIINLNPRRVIFNPGTENDEFEMELKSNNIAVEEACTLVLLKIGQY